MLRRTIEECRSRGLNSGGARTNSWCRGALCSNLVSMSTVVSRAPLVPLCKLRGGPGLPLAGADHGAFLPAGGGCLFSLTPAPTYAQSQSGSQILHNDLSSSFFGSVQPFPSAANSSAMASEAGAMAKRRREGAWGAAWCKLFQYVAGRANSDSWPPPGQTQPNLKMEAGAITQIPESPFLAHGLGHLIIF